MGKNEEKPDTIDRAGIGSMFASVNERIEPWLTQYRHGINAVFYLSFALYSCLAFYKTTMFVYIVSDGVNKLVLYAMAGLLGLACMEFAVEWILSRDRDYRWKTAVLFLMILLQIVFGHMLSSVVIFVFSLAASGKSLKKILWIYIAVGTLGMILTYQASVHGIIEYLTFENGTKHAFGIQYSTDCAAHIFYLMMAYCILKSCYSQRLAALDLLLLGTGTLFNYCYIGARSNLVCMLLLIILTLLYDFGILGSGQEVLPGAGHETGTYDEEGGKGKITFSALIKRLSYLIGILACPGLLLLCQLAAFFYREEMTASWGSALRTMKARLSMSHEAMQNYPVFTLWGNAIRERGAGGVVDESIPYFYLDSSYIRFPMLIGWVMTLSFLLLMLGIVKRAYKKGNIYLILIFAVAAVSGVMEHHLCEFSYNFLLMLAFCSSSGRAL